MDDLDEDIEDEVVVDTVEVLVGIEEVLAGIREEILLPEKVDTVEDHLVVDTVETLRVAETVDTVEDRTEVIEMIVEILQDVHMTHNKKRGNMPLFLCKYFYEFFLKYFYRKLFCALETSISHRIRSCWTHPLNSLHDLIESEVWRHKYTSFTIYYCVLKSTLIHSYERYTA